MNDTERARFLGWMSIGLGIGGLVMPEKVGRALRIGERNGLVRLVGLREVVTGVGLLTQGRKGPWLWSRVAGDTMDLVLLLASMRGNEAQPRRVGTAAAVVAAAGLFDFMAARRASHA